MDLIDVSDEQQMSREDAAARLRALADELARHNEVPFTREGVRYSVRVPDQVTFKLEIELGDDGSEIEVELTW